MAKEFEVVKDGKLWQVQHEGKVLHYTSMRKIFENVRLKSFYPEGTKLVTRFKVIVEIG